MKQLFSQGPSIGTRLLILAVLSVTLMTLDHRTSYVQAVRAGIAVLLYPLQYAITIPGDAAEWIAEGFTTRRRLMEENSTLHTQNQLLQAQLQKFASLEAENIRLRELLQSSREVGERMLVAELVSVEIDPYQRLVRLNKGDLHDVYAGQPLIDPNGVMGQVIQVDPLYSTAILITDPSHTLPVQVNRNGVRAIAVGTGAGGQLELPYQPNNADIRVGDLLVTSGLGGVYPAGYPAATVVSVEINPRLPFARIVAAPNADMDRGRQVLLVWPKRAARIASDADADDKAGDDAAAETSASSAGATGEGQP
ncbi:MAG: rod shape-determining protein MreC [Pseudomonadota bacterium]|nr:MAG: rod shape-determining protein MreC [Pseudomonadota bacterium]